MAWNHVYDNSRGNEFSNNRLYGDYKQNFHFQIKLFRRSYTVITNNYLFTITNYQA